MRTLFSTAVSPFRKREIWTLHLGDLNTSIRLDEKSIFAYLARADILSDKGQSQGAIYDLNTAIEMDPQDARAYGNRGLQQLALGEDALAEKDFKTCFMLDPALEVDYNKAANETKKNLAEVRKAAEQRKAAVQLAQKYPEDFDAQVKAAKASFEPERYLEAIEFLSKANKLRPTDYEVMVNLAGAYYATENTTDAEKWYLAALLQKPDDLNVRSDFAAIFLFGKPADLDRAIKEFQRCLEVDPNYPGRHRWFGFCFFGER